MKKVITFGVFDFFHIGHLLLFEKAKRYGDSLTVAVQEDSEILKYKPSARVYYTLEQRMHLVGSLSIVDEVCSYRDVDTDIRKMDFDVLVLGEHQDHEGFRRAVEWCREQGKTVVRVPRTEGVSSTEIKDRIQKSE